VQSCCASLVAKCRFCNCCANVHQMLSATMPTLMCNVAAICMLYLCVLFCDISWGACGLSPAAVLELTEVLSAAAKGSTELPLPLMIDTILQWGMHASAKVYTMYRTYQPLTFAASSTCAYAACMYARTTSVLIDLHCSRTDKLPLSNNCVSL
jgi:hypothetical protein